MENKLENQKKSRPEERKDGKTRKEKLVKFSTQWRKGL